MRRHAQLTLFQPRGVTTPTGKIVVKYGGGVNTWAMLVLCKRLGVVPHAILMADPGSEHAHTITYRDTVGAAWLRANGFPPVTVVSRAQEGIVRARAWRLETLYAECWRISSLPSMAYGMKKCSLKYKAQASLWWMQRQAWVAEEVVAGRRIALAIGYDLDEPSRIKDGFENSWERAHCVPWYPCWEARMDRAACADLILSEGLPAPGKSACTFCPNNTLAEWEALRRDEPQAFAAAVALSLRSTATIDQPDVVGLMRCNPHGQRQLHGWATEPHETAPDSDSETMPCECAL